MKRELGLGSQYAIELVGCTASDLGQVTEVEQAMRAAADAIGATVLSAHFHQFEPQGVSGALIISESHFAIHTWPEYGYAALDLFTCGDRRLDPQPAIDMLTQRWSAHCKKVALIVRGEGIVS